MSADNGYGGCVGNAGFALSQSCTSGEGHYSIYSGDGKSAVEYYQGANCSNSGCASYLNRMVTDVTGSGVGVGWDSASQLSQLGGLIRQSDLNQGVIPHALAMAVSGVVLNTTYTWPALSADNGSSANTGFLPEGALVAIPPDVAMPAGLSATGQMIWKALQTYGAYARDRTEYPGPGAANIAVVFGEANAGPALNSWAATGEWARIGAQLRWVTNNGPDQIGGPGNRLAPLAP